MTEASGLPRHPTILVTCDLTTAAIAELRSMGDVRLLGWGDGGWFASEAALRSALRDVDVLVAGYEMISASILDDAPRLRVIASVRTDPRANVDVDAATARGIVVLHTEGRTDHAVAEYTVGVMLAMARKVVPAAEWVRHRPKDFVPTPAPYASSVSWGGPPNPTNTLFEGFELNGRTFGLVGFGGIGRMVARKISGFGMTVIATDPYVNAQEAGELEVRLVEFDELLELSDVISVHARLTPETTGLFDRAVFDRMKAGAILVNTARAALVDRAALLSALDSGRLAGAALDVFHDEPVDEDDPLVTHPHVLPTPHIAGWTSELRTHHSVSLLAELRRIGEGRPPRLISNPEVLAAAR